MTNIKAISIFPELYEPFTHVGVMKMAIEKGILNFEAVDLRNYTHDRHHTTDDVPFGGGSGDGVPARTAPGGTGSDR